MIYSEIFGHICTNAVSYSSDSEYHLNPNEVQNQIKIASDIHKWIINIAKEVKEEDERALMAIRIGIKMKLPLEDPIKLFVLTYNLYILTYTFFIILFY